MIFIRQEKIRFPILSPGLSSDSPVHQGALGLYRDYMIESLMEDTTFGDPGLTRLDIWRTAQLLREHMMG